MIKSYTVGWGTQAEAEEFVSHERQQFSRSEEYSYVDHAVSYNEDSDEWDVRIDYLETDPEAA